jgi:hypothetical protein
VQNSLLNIKKNLNLEGDDIFTKMLINPKSTSGSEKQEFKRQESNRRRLVDEPVVNK